MIKNNELEVPWAVEISRVDGADQKLRTVHPASPGKEGPVSVKGGDTYKTYGVGRGGKVIASPLDFRASESRIFLPAFLFRYLGLRPGEVVLVGFRKKVEPAGLVKFRPLQFKNGGICDDGIPIGGGGDFLKIANHQAVLETELKHYAVLTSGTVVSMVYNGKRYFFEVVECREGVRGRRIDGVKVQDSDIRVEFTKVKKFL